MPRIPPALHAPPAHRRKCDKIRALRYHRIRHHLDPRPAGKQLYSHRGRQPLRPRDLATQERHRLRTDLDPTPAVFIIRQTRPPRDPRRREFIYHHGKDPGQLAGRSPETNRTAMTENQSSHPSSQPSAPPITAVLIDDEPLARMIVSEYLQTH